MKIGVPFCAKQKINLRRTIFRSAPDDFQISAQRKSLSKILKS
ncbi:hypothetical protein HMPREF9442_00868 [Paraprevotella xylaniphila YIT 11841]|uniref:Uncharacterized protein n=1 Tax=Paraprevotella xylaniphila YIT 11841 TaxID=762982 RepID=F3QRV2_9BACT|nr:hypothetical protein HMPREF9442_00868 [Paraprevotella xylaniphila YIT 11841]